MSKAATATRQPRIIETSNDDGKSKVSAAIAKGQELNKVAIASSLDNEKALKAATFHNLLLAANPDIGRVDLLNDLWKGVSVGDRETMRLFLANVTAKYGTKIEGNDGNTRIVSMLKFQRDTGFSSNFGATQTNDTVREAANEMRRKVFSAGETGLAKLTFGKSADRVARDAENDFDPFKVVRRAVSQLMKNGAEELAKIINRDIGTNGYNEQELASLKPDTDKQLATAKARVASLEKRIAAANVKPDTKPEEKSEAA